MRKWTSSLVGVVLVFALAVPALAATVPGSVYSQLPPCTPGDSRVDCLPADVSADSFAVAAVVAVREAGIMVGYEDGSFHPDDTVTVAQAATIILRIIGQAPPLGQGDAWYGPAISQAQGGGYLSASQASNPTGDISRADVAVMIAKALGLQPVFEPPHWSDLEGVDAETQGYLAALYRAGIFKGYPDGTFKPGQTLTRAEMAILIDRILSKYGKH